MLGEAKLMKGQNTDVEINMIRNRTGLISTSGATMIDLKRERRFELAGEWTDRHFYLQINRQRYLEKISIHRLKCCFSTGSCLWGGKGLPE